MRWLKYILSWLEDRTGLAKAILPLMRHTVPPKTGWKYVFGSATLFAFLLQVVTGTILSLGYIPSSGEAYQTLEFITHKAVMGNMLRGMHYFGASAMILLMGVHVSRVFLTASYKFPREMNWLSGVGLFFLTILMGFTGQLLRWDQNAVWSVVVGAEQAGRAPFIGKQLAHFMLGGDVLGGATLSRFFSSHVFFLPGLLFAFIGLHLFLVLRNGISEVPKAGNPVKPETYREEYEKMLKKEGVPFWPDAAWRDVVFGSLMILAVLALALFSGPPELTGPPNPSNLVAYPRPDWYLLWYFAVLALLPHGTEAYVIVLAPSFLFFGMALLPFFFKRGERSPTRRPWAVISVICGYLILVCFTILGIIAPWSPRFGAKPLVASAVGKVSPAAQRGALLFHEKACEYCHKIESQGGLRGPDLTYVADRLSRNLLVIRLMNGGPNMPSYANNLTPGELDDIIAFLETRKRVPPITNRGG